MENFFVLLMPCLFIYKKLIRLKRPSVLKTSLQKMEKYQNNKKKKKYFQYSKRGMLNHTENLAKAEKQENPITPFCTINQKTQFNKPGISSSLQFLFSFHRATGFWLRRFLVDHNCYDVCKC